MVHYYPPAFAFYFAIILIVVLFLLQIWAILRIRRMFGQVSEIFRFVKAGTRVYQSLPGRKTSTCEFCRFRETYINSDRDLRFVYWCKRHDEEIQLDHSCAFFKPDPLNKEK